MRSIAIIASPVLYPGAATALIADVVNILKRFIVPGPVVYSVVPSAVNGTIAPSLALR